MTRQEACNAALMPLTIMKTLVCDYTFMYLKESRPAFALPQEPNWNSLESVHWLSSMSAPGMGNLFINVFTVGILRFVLQFNVHCPQVRVEFTSAHWEGIRAHYLGKCWNLTSAATEAFFFYFFFLFLVYSCFVHLFYCYGSTEL